MKNKRGAVAGLRVAHLDISINILGPRTLSLPARRGERAFAVPWSGPSVPARRGEGPSQFPGPAPPFRPAGAMVLRSSLVRPLRSGPQGRKGLRSSLVRPLNSWSYFLSGLSIPEPIFGSGVFCACSGIPNDFYENL